MRIVRVFKTQLWMCAISVRFTLTRVTLPDIYLLVLHLSVIQSVIFSHGAVIQSFIYQSIIYQSFNQSFSVSITCLCVPLAGEEEIWQSSSQNQQSILTTADGAYHSLHVQVKAEVKKVLLSSGFHFHIMQIIDFC